LFLNSLSVARWSRRSAQRLRTIVERAEPRTAESRTAESRTAESRTAESRAAEPRTAKGASFALTLPALLVVLPQDRSPGRRPAAENTEDLIERQDRAR
jgi:hypothetical protein